MKPILIIVIIGVPLAILLTIVLIHYLRGGHSQNGQNGNGLKEVDLGSGDLAYAKDGTVVVCGEAKDGTVVVCGGADAKGAKQIINLNNRNSYSDLKDNIKYSCSF